MPHIARIILTIIVLLAPIASHAMAADEVSEVRHSRHFNTAGRKIVVVSADTELKHRLTERLAAHGATVVDDFISRMFSPRVTVSHATKIDGHAEAYCIEVGKSKVAITYTSQEMLDRAVKQFYFLFDSPYGQRLIRGVNVCHYADQPQKSTVKRNKAGIIDGVTTVLTTAQVESAIRAQLRSNPNSYFTLAIINRQMFRFDFNALRTLNANAKAICPADAKYSIDQIRRFVATAREAGGEFVPAIDLLSNNAPFEAYTGHPMSSVEGMRFVRAIIEECSRTWGIKSICIGRRANCEAGQQYFDFLNDIGVREGIELIIL